MELCESYLRDPDAFSVSDPRAVTPGIEKARRQAYYMSARALDKLGRFGEAIQALEKTVRIAPGFTEAYFSLGDFYYKAGRYEKARAAFLRVLRDKPDEPRTRAYLYLVESTLKARLERKKPSLRKAVPLYRAALRDYKMGEIDQAADKLRRALAIVKMLRESESVNVEAAKILTLLGRARLEQKNPGDARTCLEAAIARISGLERGDAPDRVVGEANYWMAVVLEDAGERDKAAAHFKTAARHLRKASEGEDGAFEKAELLVLNARASCALGDFADEFSCYKKASEISPRYPSIHYLAGKAGLRAGKFSEAAEEFERSIACGSRVAESHLELGVLLFRRARHTEAILHFLDVIRSTKEKYFLAASNYYLGHAFYARGMYEEASRAWREYLKYEVDPQRKDAIERRLKDDPNLKSLQDK